MSCRELRVNLKWNVHLLHESVLGSFVVCLTTRDIVQ